MVAAANTTRAMEFWRCKRARGLRKSRRNGNESWSHDSLENFDAARQDVGVGGMARQTTDCRTNALHIYSISMHIPSGCSSLNDLLMVEWRMRILQQRGNHGEVECVEHRRTASLAELAYVLYRDVRHTNSITSIVLLVHIFVR